MLSAILGEFLPYIISALIGIGALIGVYAGGRKAGADKTKRKAADKRADDLQTTKEVRDEVDRTDGDAVAGELHEWTRD